MIVEIRRLSCPEILEQLENLEGVLSVLLADTEQARSTALIPDTLNRADP
jgi:hypothetical protein